MKLRTAKKIMKRQHVASMRYYGFLKRYGLLCGSHKKHQELARESIRWTRRSIEADIMLYRARKRYMNTSEHIMRDLTGIGHSTWKRLRAQAKAKKDVKVKKRFMKEIRPNT